MDWYEPEKAEYGRARAPSARRRAVADRVTVAA